MSLPSPSPVATRLTLVNGQWTDVISVKDRGLAYGDGVFETCRLTQGEIPLWRYHQERLLASAAKLYIALDSARLTAEFNEFLTALRQQNMASGAVKIIVTRGEGGVGVIPPSLSVTSVIWQFMPIADTQAQSLEGVSLVVSPCKLAPNPALAGLKHLNRLDYVLAAAQRPPAIDEQILLLDFNHHPIETLHHNIFWLQGLNLMTPKLAETGVAGIMRRIIIERLATTLSLNPTQGQFTLADIEHADEVFICNSLRGIWPVKRLAERSWSIGPVTRQLQMLERTLWEIKNDI